MSAQANPLLRWLLVVLLSAGAAGLSRAQEGAQPPAPEQQPVQETAEGQPGELQQGEEPPPAFFEEGVSDEELQRMDALLEEDAALLDDTGYIYNAEGRRDPFRSLLVIADVPATEGPRPEGIPGLLIDELTVTGIYVTADGPVAQVQSTDSPKSYLLRPGDQLFDGDVLRIDYVKGGGGEVVFKQVENDPAAPKPFREVSKRLQP